MYIPIVLGTARRGRQSEKVAALILEEAKKAGMETEIIDVREYRIEATDNTEEIPQAKTWAAKVKKAAGLIIVSPEYNHTYPGELKMFLDMIYEPYFGKPVGLVGVSAGQWGGTRGIQALRLTCLALGLRPLLQTVYFPQVGDLFDSSGKLQDASYRKPVSGLLKALSAEGGQASSGKK